MIRVLLADDHGLVRAPRELLCRRARPRSSRARWESPRRRSRTIRAGLPGDRRDRPHDLGGTVSLIHRERPADGDARRPAWCCTTGAGTDETDLLGLADVLDPSGASRGVATRAAHPPGLARLPLVRGPAGRLPGPRDLPRELRRPVGVARRALGADWDGPGADGPGRVLDGLGHELRPRALRRTDPGAAGILAFSGFVPRSTAGSPTSPARARLRGRSSPTGATTRSWRWRSRGRARDLLRSRWDSTVEYHESDAAHQIDPAHLPAAVAWLGQTL